MKNNSQWAQIGLILVAIIWGGTFVLVKGALNDAPPFSFTSLRFGLATTLTLIFINKKIFSLTKYEFIGGLICSFLLFSGYSFQNFGLMETTASKSAFITSISVIMVPFILVILKMQIISIRTWIAAFLATSGLYLLLILGENKLNLGDLLTFGCALSFALHIIAQDVYIKKGIRLLPFFFVQSGFVTLFSLINAQITESHTIIWSNRLILAVLITGILATFFAILIMIWAQKILKPTETALIFSLEPVAATLFAVVLGGEILGLWGWVGGSLICLAVAYGRDSD